MSRYGGEEYELFTRPHGFNEGRNAIVDMCLAFGINQCLARAEKIRAFPAAQPREAQAEGTSWERFRTGEPEWGDPFRQTGL